MSEMILLLLPGAMYFWVLFIGQGAMQDILREKETRVLPRILSCPVTPGQYLISKQLRCFVLCSLAVILLLITSSLLFGVNWGNPLLLALIVAAWAVSMTGILALITCAVRTRDQANVISPIVLLLFAMVGGGMFPYESLPPIMQAVGRLTPNHWAVLLLLGSAHAKPLAELMRPFIELCATGLLGAVMGLFLFKRQCARGHLR